MKTLLHLCVLLCMLPVSLATARDPVDSDVLAPTPARTPSDVEQTMREHGIPEVALDESERTPTQRSVVGAITGLDGGRIGFMPLLQHHMGVEHWFVEGLTRENLARWPTKGERLLVRLEGTVALERLWSPFGGATGFYGDGLPHGKVYGGPGGGVMGYHESVYRLVVKQVAWVRTRAEFGQVAAAYRKLEEATKSEIEAGRWQRALEIHREAQAFLTDLAMDQGMNRPSDLVPALSALVLLTGDPSTWTDADLDTIAIPFEGEFPGPLGKQVAPTLTAAVATWTPEVRARLGKRLVAVWRGLEYRFQKENLRKGALRIIGGSALQELELQIAREEAELAMLGEHLAQHVEAHEYAQAKAVWEEMGPRQHFLRTHEYGTQRTQHWLPSLHRLVALEQAWPDAARRMQVLDAQIRAAVEAGDDLPNNSYRPRYPRELVEHFLPLLEPSDKRRIEALLIELAEKLDPGEDWDSSLVAAELLTGVAGPAAAAFMPGFVARRETRPEWQRRYLEAYAAAMR